MKAPICGSTLLYGPASRVLQRRDLLDFSFVVHFSMVRSKSSIPDSDPEIDFIHNLRNTIEASTRPRVCQAFPHRWTLASGLPERHFPSALRRGRQDTVGIQFLPVFNINLVWHPSGGEEVFFLIIQFQSGQTGDFFHIVNGYLHWDKTP